MKNITLANLLLLLLSILVSTKTDAALNPLPSRIEFGMNRRHDQRFREYMKRQIKKIIRYRRKTQKLCFPLLPEQWFRIPQEEPQHEEDVHHDDEDIERFYKLRRTYKKKYQKA